MYSVQISVAPAQALACTPLLLEMEAELGWEGEGHLGLWLWAHFLTHTSSHIY